MASPGSTSTCAIQRTRATHIDRIGSPFKMLWEYNTLGEERLERLLRLVESPSRMIQTGDPRVLLDAVREVGAPEVVQPASQGTRGLTEEDLHLVCWEYVWS